MCSQTYQKLEQNELVSIHSTHMHISEALIRFFEKWGEKGIYFMGTKEQMLNLREWEQRQYWEQGTKISWEKEGFISLDQGTMYPLEESHTYYKILTSTTSS